MFNIEGCCCHQAIKTKLALTSVLRICITLTRIKTGTLLDVRYAGSFSLQCKANGWPALAKIRGFLSRCQLDSRLNKKRHSKQAPFKTEGAPSTKLEMILQLPNSTRIKQNVSWNSSVSGKLAFSWGSFRWEACVQGLFEDGLLTGHIY